MVGGGAGLLILLIGAIWLVNVRRAKRRAERCMIVDRKFYPDQYNQTVTSSRHSEYNEIEPGPVVVPLPPPHPPPLLHRSPSVYSTPLSRRTSSYHNHNPFPRAHGGWAGGPLHDEVLEDIPPLARHRVPYPNSSPQPSVDRYTILPSRSASTSNTPATPIRFAPDPSYHTRSFPLTHRRHNSDLSYHGHSRYQRHDAEHTPHFPPIRSSKPTPPPLRIPRRSTVLVSPPMSPSSFSFLSSPLEDHPLNRVETTTITLSSRPSIIRSTFSSIDPLDAVDETPTVKRMMCTNPDLDVDPETDTEPDEPGGSGRNGSPSATDIIRLYGGDREVSTTACSVGGKTSPAVSTTSISTKDN